MRAGQVSCLLLFHTQCRVCHLISGHRRGSQSIVGTRSKNNLFTFSHIIIISIFEFMLDVSINNIVM